MLRRHLLAAPLMLAAAPALAAWPEQPLRIVVPYPAGGAVDVMLRVVLPKLSERLGQPVVVDNRAGANANLGPDHVSKARPDGYTLLASATYLVLNPLLQDELSWKPNDFLPVARLTQTPNLFVVAADSPWQSLGDFVTAARSRPGLAVASSGPGAPQSMVQELLRVRAGLDFTLVPYRGAPPAMTDILNGTVEMGVMPLGAVQGMLQGGKLRALAVAGARSPLLPRVPSTAEAGYPDIVVESWYGLHAPAGTEASILRALASAARDATTHAEVRAMAARAGGEAAFLGTTDFTAFLATDRERWGTTVSALRG